MRVKVISRRIFQIEQRDQLLQLLADLRKQAEDQRGFISRTTCSNLHDPGDYLVISEWETVDHWIDWMNLREVKTLHTEVDTLLGARTRFDIYIPEVC